MKRSSMELNQLSPIWRQLAGLDAAAEDHLELTNEIRTSGLSGSSYLRQEPRPGGFEKKRTVVVGSLRRCAAERERR